MMMLECGSFKQPLALAPVVQALFDTVACRLESTRRGSRYPLLLDRLHDGRLGSQDATAALQELSAIQAGLEGLPASQILGAAPVSKDTRSAGQLFAAPITQLRAALQSCAGSGQPLYLNNDQRRRVEFYLALCLLFAGLAWCSFTYALFPNWYLVSAVVPNSQDGIPVWRAGFIPVAVSLTYIVSSRSPALRYWFLRRQWAVVSLAIAGALAFAALTPVKFH